MVDLSKEEDPEEREMEESAEKGRERRRRRGFFECLGGEEVDLGESESCERAERTAGGERRDAEGGDVERRRLAY